jgi:hypothetical protein
LPKINSALKNTLSQGKIPKSGLDLSKGYLSKSFDSGDKGGKKSKH